MRKVEAGQELRILLPDRPESPARARELLRDLDGASAERIEDARILLHELVAAALFEGVESVDVHVSARRDHLRLEVVREKRDRGAAERSLTAAGQLGHLLIRDLSDRQGHDGTVLWCELDGAWSLGTVATPERRPPRKPSVRIGGTPLMGARP